MTFMVISRFRDIDLPEHDLAGDLMQGPDNDYYSRILTLFPEHTDCHPINILLK